MSEKHTTDEFAGNVKVTISENEVRVWVCDEKGCQFRFKAMGKVVKSGGMDVMVVAKNNSHDALLEALQRISKQENARYKLGIGYDSGIDRIAKTAIDLAEKEGA